MVLIAEEKALIDRPVEIISDYVMNLETLDAMPMRRQPMKTLSTTSLYQRLSAMVSAVGLLVLVSTSTACAAAPQQQGRYIIYVDATTLAELKSPQRQTTQLAEWSKTLGGDIKLERELATGGWVFTVTSPAASSEQQIQGLQQLPGVESVERDAIMRHY